MLALTGTRGVALGEGDAELVLFADEEEVLRYPVHVGAVERIRDAELFLGGEPLGVGGAVAFTPSDARPPVPLEVVWGGRSRTLEVRADNGATVF